MAKRKPSRRATTARSTSKRRKMPARSTTKRSKRPPVKKTARKTAKATAKNALKSTAKKKASQEDCAARPSRNRPKPSSSQAVTHGIKATSIACGREAAGPGPRAPDPRTPRADAALLAGHGPPRIGGPVRPGRAGGEPEGAHGHDAGAHRGRRRCQLGKRLFQRRRSAQAATIRRPMKTSSKTSARRLASSIRTAKCCKGATRSSNATSTGGSWTRHPPKTTRTGNRSRSLNFEV